MQYTVKDILKIKVAPALGFTEPVAIALGAASARALLPDKAIGSIEVSVDPNICKNGLAVTIPGTEGLVGLETAAAVGARGSDPALKLDLIWSIIKNRYASVLKPILPVFHYSIIPTVFSWNDSDLNENQSTS